MNSELKTFAFQLAVITAVLAALGILLFTFIPEHYFKAFPLCFIIFYAVSFFSHRSLLKALKKDQSRFNNVFMISFLTKLFIYTTFAAAVLFFSEENKKAFALSLLIFYAVYTVFDVRKILSALRNF